MNAPETIRPKRERPAQEKSPLNKMVSFRLSRAQAKLNTQANRILKRHGGLSLAQWRVLVVLDVLEVSTHTEIARLTEIDKGLLSRTIKGMIASGLIKATQSPSDSRQYQLEMSREGRDRFDAARPAMRERQRKLLSSMPEEDIENLFRALAILEAVAEDGNVPT